MKKYIIALLIFAISFCIYDASAKDPWEKFDKSKKSKKSKKDDPVVPEPATYGFFLIGGSMAFYLLRRRYHERK